MTKEINLLRFLYSQFHGTVGRIGRQGWRPAFCWGGGAVVLYAMKVAYIDLPLAHITMSSEYLTCLNVATLTILGAMGLRAAEKFAENRQAQNNMADYGHGVMADNMQGKNQ